MRFRMPMAFVLATLAGTALAQPYRDDLTVPSYRLLSSMLAQFKDPAPLERTGKTLEFVAPLVENLDSRYGTNLKRELREAIGLDDHGRAFAATGQLVLLDAQDLLGTLQRDEYAGWARAATRAKKAYLDYGLVAGEVRRLQPELDRRVLADFGRLSMALRDADLTTSPEGIAAARDAIQADLVAARTALVWVRPPAADAGAKP